MIKKYIQKLKEKRDKQKSIDNYRSVQNDYVEKLREEFEGVLKYSPSIILPEDNFNDLSKVLKIDTNNNRYFVLPHTCILIINYPNYEYINN